MIMNKKQLSILAIFNMSFHWFAIGIIIPVMILFLLEKGLNLVQVGIVGATYGTAVVLLELPTGGLADSIGRKKVYLISLVFLVASSILLLLVNSFALILIAGLLQGVARSLSSGTMDAHFIDEFYRIDPEVNLQQEMAKIGIFIPLALGIGSLFGGFLPMSLGVLTEKSFLSSVYASNYVIIALVLIIQMLATAVLVKEKKRTGEDSTIIGGFKKIPEVLGTSVKYGLKHPVILLILCAGFAWGFSISGLEQLWQPQAESLISDSTGSWIFGVLTFGYFLASSIGNMLVTPICKIFKDNYTIVLFLARLLMGVLYFILAMQNGIILFSVFYVTLFMFNGVQGSPESSIFNGEVPSEKRSTLLSFSSLFLQGGGILGSLIMGFLAQTYSIKIAWITASVVISASALLYLLIPYFKEKRETGLINEF
jgi:MFS transporter, DHA1 family, quinolone resistance protein